MTRKQLIAAMRREQKTISKSRNMLRSIINEAEGLEEHAAEACERIEEAIDVLSRTL